MPLTEKQLISWESIKLQLKHNLLSSITKDHWPSLKRMKLLTLVSEAFEQNTGPNSIFMVAFELFTEQYDLQIKKKRKPRDALELFNETPEIVAALDQLHDYILLKVDEPSSMIENDNSLETSDFTQTSTSSEESLLPAQETSVKVLQMDFSLATMKENIQKWVNKYYSSVDERVLSNNETRIRRMDNLACLLALERSLSACTAVTINLSGPPQLVIGANVYTHNEQEIIFNEITLKLNAIRHFLTNISLKCNSKIDSENLDKLATSLVGILLFKGSFFAPLKTLHLAAKKIIHAVCFDHETFTEEEKSAFTSYSPAVIILPVNDSQNILNMQVRQLSPSGTINSEFVLTNIPPKTHVKFIHAEQLIARYLFEELKIKPESPLLFGISKLCCMTCFEYLSNYPVTIRGHHSQWYQGVVNLYTGLSPKTSSSKQAITCAWPSPINTPERIIKHNPSAAKADDSPKGKQKTASAEVTLSKQSIFSTKDKDKKILPPPNLMDSDAPEEKAIGKDTIYS